MIQNFLPDAYKLEYNFKCESVTSKGSSKQKSSSKASGRTRKGQKEAVDSEDLSVGRKPARGVNIEGSDDIEELNLITTQRNPNLLRKVCVCVLEKERRT